MSTSTAILAEATYPVENPNLMYGAYVAANLGYAWIPYQHNIGNSTTALQTPATQTLSWSNGNGGFVWGGDVGYQFNRNLAVEFGAFRFPITTAKVSSTQQQFNRFSSWTIFTDMKFIAPVFEQFAIFAKAGAAYYMMNAHPLNATAKQNDNQLVPMFAVGTSYAFRNSVVLDLTYTHLGSNYTPGITLPDVSALTAGIGYKFES